MSTTKAEKHASGPLTVSNLFSVSGMVAVVTGGGTGIGLMITQGLVANGARVYITGRRAEALDKVVKEYSTADNQIIGMPCDITSKPALQKLADDIAAREQNGINILINNAGIAPEDHTRGNAPAKGASPAEIQRWLWESEPSEWEGTLRTNVTAQYFCAVAFLPLLVTGGEKRAGHSPSIINITSVSGVLKSGSMGQFAYSASKAAMIHLTRNLASVLQDCRVRVNSIAPGLFPSEMTARVPGDEKTGKSYLEQGVGKDWPAKRAGDEGDMVGAVIWLASPAGVFHNGHTVYLDGGLTLVSPSAA